ncbi:hypothetical protein BD309DRAFT_863017, partial [Dichomitus squalens]
HAAQYLRPASPAFLAIIPFILYVRSIVKWRARARGRSLPPGPTQLPSIGNMFNLPRFNTWVAFRDLSSLYGDIIHFRILGQSIVVLGATDVITGCLEKHPPTPPLECVLLWSICRYNGAWSFADTSTMYAA